MGYGAAATLRINLDAVIANYQDIERRVAPAAAAAVVKADSYGLGARQVSQALWKAGCRHFFVAHLREAADLKPALPGTAHFYILNGLQPGTEPDCAGIGAIPVLNSPEQIGAWNAAAAALGETLPAVLQVDTGMTRLGLSRDEIEDLCAHKERLRGVDLRFVMSHLACADTPQSPFNQHQRDEFVTLASHFPGIARSLDNSGGSMMEATSHGDLVRPGIALYGAAPHSPPSPMQPVVELTAYIVQLRDVPVNTGIGYGLTHVSKAPMRTATISVGYADGWPCSLGNRGHAYIGGVRVPVVGRVSMDSMILDVTHVPDLLLYAGAPVELIGANQTVDDVAQDAGTISYEILTRLGHRYDRKYHSVLFPELSTGHDGSIRA